ncbi:unnamed protein product [Hymenolepis diminuta]|uniref:Secreted protein n=1 Tax=Hymenolepis diminuta TaxID=6216 RepID=A0A0R3SN32_HYMDI|nr:unnamed protein product [Hymenolepis diminuta]
MLPVHGSLFLISSVRIFQGYASGICYPPPLPPSYTPDFGRFPPPYQYPPRPPSVGYRNFNRRCNTDSTLDPVSFFLNLTTFCGSLDRFY